MGVLADLGAKVNMRKRTVRIDPDIVKHVSTEWGNKRDWVSLKIGDTGKKAEEVMFDKFLLRNPKFFSVVVNDCILVRVTVDDVSTGGGMEEVGEEVFYRYSWE